jgi:hypothetical protein
MTNEHVANIAITVTAAMLATAAVAFTLSGNAPADSRAGDLPVVSVGAKTANAAAPGAPASSPTSPGVAVPGSTAALTQHAPTATPPHSSSPAVASGTSASSASGAGAASAASGAAASHDKDPKEDEHEVVVPEVHETEEPDEDNSPETPKKH